MKDKICSLTLILAMAAQIFASAMPGNLSIFGHKNQSHQTFIDSGNAPFIAFDTSQKSKLLRYSVESYTSFSSTCIQICAVFTGHSSHKTGKAFVRPQINSPLLI